MPRLLAVLAGLLAAAACGADALPVGSLAPRLALYAKKGKGATDEIASALLKNAGGRVDGSDQAMAKVLDDIAFTMEKTDKSSGSFLVKNLNNNRQRYKDLGIAPPKYALKDLSAVLDNVVLELGRDAVPIHSGVDDVVRDLIILSRQVSVAKRLENIQGNALDFGYLGQIPDVPRAAPDVLNAFVKRQKRHKEVLGGMFADTNGFYLTLDQAKEMKPMFDALRLKRAPDSLPDAWRTKIGFAFRDVMDHGEKASSLSRAIVRRAKLQGDHKFWGRVPPATVSPPGGLYRIDPQEADRLVTEYYTTANRDWNRVGNKPVRPYSEGYLR